MKHYRNKTMLYIPPPVEQADHQEELDINLILSHSKP